jgi:hypothetical protein
MGIVLPLSLFAFLFCEKASLWPGSKGVKRKKHRPRYFGLRIADFGFFGFSFSIRIPQSAFRNLEAAYRALPNSEFGMWNSEFLLLFSIPHFHRPPDPKNETCLMVFARNALAFGPGNA